MGLPAPKLWDLSSMINADNCANEQKVWEISVPSKNSLQWSVILGYLLSGEDGRFSSFEYNLKRKIGPKSGKKMKDRNLFDSIDFKEARNILINFNPFKSRLFIRLPKLIEAFKSKLQDICGKSKSKNYAWNDNMELNAASIMLNCKIYVFCLEEKCKKRIAYPQKHAKKHVPIIVLFRYKREKLKSKAEKHNYHFAMSLEHAYPRKLNALSFILNKAQLSSEYIEIIEGLMKDVDSHGKNFIPIILNSDFHYLLPYLYQSPYLALKLSEAGFETNPALTPAFLHAAVSGADYLRILYNYASNCRHLFERTIRNPDKTMLSNLKVLHNIFENDLSAIDTWQYETKFKELVQRIVIGYYCFNTYQQNIVSSFIKLKRKPLTNLDTCKNIITNILNSYVSHFYYNLSKCSFFEKYENYLNFIEYYENIDDFSCLSYFDSIHRLKKIYQLKKENVFASVESAFFLLTVSYRYFRLVDVELPSGSSKKNCDVDENLLQFIPLLHREDLEKEIVDFLRKVNTSSESEVPLNEINERSLYECFSHFPEIIDELLIARTKIYLDAALTVSFDKDGIKGALVLERALQVLGESVIPRSTKGCVASCLLASQLPLKVTKELWNIRHNLSHYTASLNQDRLETENYVSELKHIQKELQYIEKAFRIVALTQDLRLEKLLILRSQENILKQQLEDKIIKKFSEVCEMRLIKKKQCYLSQEKYLIKLSVDIVIFLRQYVIWIVEKHKQEDPETYCILISDYDKSVIMNTFNSIKYVFEFILKELDNFIQPFLQKICIYSDKYENDENILILLIDIDEFCFTLIDHAQKNFKISYVKPSNIYPHLLSVFENVNQSCISTEEIEDITETVMKCYQEATVDRDHLKYILQARSCLTNTNELLKKLIFSSESLVRFRKHVESNNYDLALKELNKNRMSPNILAEKVKQKLLKPQRVENYVKTKINPADGRFVKIILTKIVHQNNLQIFTSKLNENLRMKLQKCLTIKVNFLLSRAKHMKSILIDEDEGIKQMWMYGQSRGMKLQIKFFMCKRFLRDKHVRASLEMALFDCLNILDKKKFREIYEKTNNLFAGINMRNVLAHGYNILETVGGLLDADDVPLEIISKMLEIIEDSDAIETMLNLIPYSETLERSSFKLWIVKNDIKLFEDEINAIKKCLKWKKYLYLLPLI